MNLEGPRPPVITKLTADDRAGLRRALPRNTAISPADSTSLRRSKPLNTLLATKPAANTSVSPAELAQSRVKGSSLTEHEKLVKQTQTWVAQTFFGTLLKQMRESPFKSELLDGGRGGQAFGSLYDQQLAEHMSRGTGNHLVNSIVRRIEARAAQVRANLPPERRAT